MKPLALALAALIAPALSAAALAQQPPARSGSAPAAASATPAKPAKPRGGAPGSPFGGMGGDSKEPIKIDANKLDVLDKDNKAVFSGNVVAVQGETTVRCSVMTVFYEGRGQGGTPRPTQPAAQGGNDGAIKRIECSGPVTVVSKTQAATSDNAVFDRANNQVIMTGNVALNDGPNITRGDKLVYNTETGVANVTSSGRVQGFFVPNQGEEGKDKKDNKAGAKPAAAPTN
ncbi:LptA/OstA family protein [Bosea sp. NPDC003192]|uniref:LptA/OstA family protein n=1 Tax=Bosea sp. NPDC003192 TaxID=3390551 RepID=UPI003CFF84F5